MPKYSAYMLPLDERPCLSSPCLNYGTCIATNCGFSCQCTMETTGSVWESKHFVLLIYVWGSSMLRCQLCQKRILGHKKMYVTKLAQIGFICIWLLFPDWRETSCVKTTHTCYRALILLSSISSVHKSYFVKVK